ncbi:MAG: hypothetical protein GYA51_14410, partial [Candidatus Methanofastidiosa archaeon]|nr:hypothetical protein [Candidatus Methanofastidiosa archaeon]
MNKVINLIFYVLILFFSSCKEEIEINEIVDKFNGNQSLVIPLGSFDAEVSSIISNYFKDNKYVKLEGDDVYFNINDSSNFIFHYLSFIDKVQPFQVNSPLTTSNVNIPVNTQKLFQLNSEIDFGINNNPEYERIDSIIFNTVTFFIDLQNSEIIPLDIDSIIISSKKLSKPLVYRKNHFITSTKNIKVFPQTDGKVPVQINIFFRSTQTKTITSQTRFALNLRFNELNFDIAYGYFKPSVSQRQVLTRRLVWNDFLRNSLLRFSNPKIDVRIRTNVGANLRFEFDSVFATYSDHTKVYAEFEGKRTMSENIGLKPSKPGDVITYNLRTFDNEYGKTWLLFDKLDKPDSLIYAYGASLNEEAYSIDKNPDFLLPDAKVYVKIQAKLPFQLNELSNYLYIDSVTDINRGLPAQIKEINYGNIDSVFLVLQIKNSLPVSASIKFEYLDAERKNINADVQNEFKIDAGRVDASGKVIEPFNNEIAILLTKLQFETIRNRFDKLLMQIKFAGKDESAKIYIT